METSANGEANRQGKISANLEKSLSKYRQLQIQQKSDWLELVKYFDEGLKKHAPPHFKPYKTSYLASKLAVFIKKDEKGKDYSDLYVLKFKCENAGPGKWYRTLMSHLYG